MGPKLGRWAGLEDAEAGTVIWESLTYAGAS